VYYVCRYDIYIMKDRFRFEVNVGFVIETASIVN